MRRQKSKFSISAVHPLPTSMVLRVMVGQSWANEYARVILNQIRNSISIKVDCLGHQNISIGSEGFSLKKLLNLPLNTPEHLCINHRKSILFSYLL